MKKIPFSVILLLSFGMFVNAQTADFTVPSWTQYQRTIVAGEPNTCVLAPKETPFNVNTAINGNPSTQFGAAWFTNEGITGTKLQLVQGLATSAEDFASPLRIIVAVETAVSDLNYNVSANNLNTLAGFANNLKKSYVSNKVLIDNLTPNTTYSYRVGGLNGIWSDIFSFTTAKTNKDEFSFIYIADTQANTDEMFEISRKTVVAAQQYTPEAKFILQTGDLIETGNATTATSTSEWEWEQYFETMKASLQKLPLAPMQGNHDRSPLNNMFQHINTDNSFNETSAVTSSMPGTNYSFVYGDALFICINYEDYNKAGYLDALEAWMRNEIDTKGGNVKWKIVAFHKTMFTGSGSHQNDADGKQVRERMSPVFTDLNIDFVLQGHDHIYEVIGVLKAAKVNENIIYTHLPNAVTGQTFQEPSTATTNNPDVTGIHGGIYNVSYGTLYFLNNSAGRKKYQHLTEAQMNSNLSTHAVPNYYSFFNRFGQTGEPTFSKITVSTEKITVSTYTVDDYGIANLFDEFEIVKNEGDGTNIKPAQAEVSKMLIYPNPAKKSITIDTKEVIESICIFSMTGRKVLSQQGGNTVNISDINSGIYVLDIKTSNGAYSEQLIINK